VLEPLLGSEKKEKIRNLRGKVRLFGINPRYPFKKELEALLKRALTFLPADEKVKFYTPRLRPRRTGKPR